MLGLRNPRATLPDRLRLRAIGAVTGGPGGVLGVLATAALITGLAGLALLAGGSAPGPQPHLNAIAKWCLAGLVAAGLIGLGAAYHGRARRRGPGVPPVAPERARRDLLTAVMLGAAGLLPALLLPVHYLAARTHPAKGQWLAFGFLDKRWLTSLFLISVVGSALLLVVAARLVATASTHPGSWRAWLGHMPAPEGSGAPTGDGPPDERRRASSGVKLLCAVLVAAYFFGPPWNLPPHRLGYHETQMMGGVQAIATGSLPYIDAAAIQYGPGAEVANYAFAKGTGQMSVDGLRETSLLFTWIAATLFLGALYLRVRPLVAAVTSVAALTLFPTLQMLHFRADGFNDGFWGWTNPLRYAGVFVLAMLFPALVARAPGRAMQAIALGAVWGVLCLVGQENLIGGALLLGVLTVLLVASQTARPRAVVGTLAGVVAGFLLIAIPVCAFYLAHGRLGRALELYWLIPRAVAAGYSNTNWAGDTSARLFYLLPLLLAALLLAALLAGRPLRVATGWCDRRVVLVSALAAAVICHLGSLTRSDLPHLKNTELALPAAICLAAFHLPGLLGVSSRPGRWTGGAAIALAAVALLPLAPYSSAPKRVAETLWQPAMARLSPPAQRPLPAGIPRDSIGAARVGKTTVRRRRCCSRAPEVTMATFVHFLDRLHAVVGTRRVYVDSAPILSAPAIYFLADLRPAPTRQDYGTMVLDTGIREQWLRQFRDRLPEIRAVVTKDPTRRAPAMWLAANPRHRTVALPCGPRRKAYVLLR